MQRGVDGRRGFGNRYKVFGRCERRHRFPVVIELGGLAVTGRDHPKLVGPLEGDFGPGRVSQRRPEAARVLVGDHRREAHRAGSGQAPARGLQNVDSLGLQRHLNGGRGYNARWISGGCCILRFLLRFPGGNAGGRNQANCQRQQQGASEVHAVDHDFLLRSCGPVNRRRGPTQRRRARAVTESCRIRTSCQRWVRLLC